MELLVHTFEGRAVAWRLTCLGSVLAYCCELHMFLRMDNEQHMHHQSYTFEQSTIHGWVLPHMLDRMRPSQVPKGLLCPTAARLASESLEETTKLLDTILAGFNTITSMFQAHACVTHSPKQ
jgi:hypothetical protein